jgi:hypothetical protein
MAKAKKNAVTSPKSAKVVAGADGVIVVKGKASRTVKAGKTAKVVKSTKIARKTSLKPQTDNPYRIGSSYWFCIEAMRSLGLGKNHSQEKVVAKIKAMMIDIGGAETWKAFAAKGKRNDETGKDALSRCWQNCSVVARAKDYGLPLIECGYRVEFNGREKVCGLHKL